MPLKLGLFSMTTGPCTYPDGAARVARAAETAGFDSLWGGEHVVLPDPRVPPSPLEPEDRIMDPVVTLAFLAAIVAGGRLLVRRDLDDLLTRARTAAGRD